MRKCPGQDYVSNWENWNLSPDGPVAEAQAAAFLPQPPGSGAVKRPLVTFAPPSSHPVFMDEDTQIPRGARLDLIFLLSNLIPLVCSQYSQARNWLITDFHHHHPLPNLLPSHLVGPRQGLGICRFASILLVLSLLFTLSHLGTINFPLKPLSEPLPDWLPSFPSPSACPHPHPKGTHSPQSFPLVCTPGPSSSGSPS